MVARTDATDESEILRRAETLAATDADVLLVDGVRSVDGSRKVRGVVGDKPLLFNQIAGGKSPRLSLTELQELGVDVAIYSTPCLFAAHTAMDNAVDRTARRTTADLPRSTPTTLASPAPSRCWSAIIPVITRGSDSTGPRKCALPADISTSDRTVHSAAAHHCRGSVVAACTRHRRSRM